MMKRKAAALLLTLILLTGCAANKAPESKELPEEETKTEAPEVTPPVVENNGEYYVRVGDKIYFRRYGAKALPKAMVFGEFAKLWNLEPGGESELMAYEPATGTLTSLYAETGSGPLWYGDGGFYLCEAYNETEHTVWYDPEGGKAEELCLGRPLGITENGLLAVERIEYVPAFREVYAFYRNKTPVGELTTEEIMTSAGLTEDGLFLLGSVYNEAGGAEHTIWQITPEGKLLRLGVLPGNEEEPMIYDARPDRFLATEGKVTVGVGYYAGTAYFLDHCVFAEAEPGREDSLRVLDYETPENQTEIPRLTPGENGAVIVSDVPDGELMVASDEDGALKLRENGAWQTVAEHFAPEFAAGWGFCRIPQQMAYIDGAAYVTLACAHTSPADSVGWREAYALLDMLYLKVDRDGTVTELSAVDHEAELFGNVWFIEGAGVALWQQLSSANGEGYNEEFYCYAIPIADNAYWEGGWEKVWDGVTGLLPFDYGEGKADYYGYPVPETEPAGALCLTLDREGQIVSLSRKDPAAVMGVDFDVPEAELKGAAATLPLERRPSDEDCPQTWAKLRVLEDNVHVRLERSQVEKNETEAYAQEQGIFLPGETVYDGVLNRGDFLAVRVSLPWNPELRVSAGKDGAWGSYVFGEDNSLHLGTPELSHPELTLAAYPPEYLSINGDDGLLSQITGKWLYRNPDTGEAVSVLGLDEKGSLTLGDGNVSYALTAAADRLYAGEFETCDLLRLSTKDPAAAERIGFDGGVGDYLVELYRTEGEELLHLVQANNGDGALSFLLPDQRYDFVFTRPRGAAEPMARRREASFPAVTAKYDEAAGLLWLREAKAVDELPGGGDLLRADPKAPCTAYPIAPELAKDLRQMEIRRVSVNGAGEITELAPLEQNAG